MADPPPTPVFSDALERRLRVAVEPPSRRRPAALCAVIAATTVLALTVGWTSTPQSAPAAVHFADGAQLQLADRGPVVARLRRAFDRRGLQLDVVAMPSAQPAGSLLALIAPPDAIRDGNEVSLRQRSALTTAVVARSPRPGERIVGPLDAERLTAGAASRLRQRLVLTDPTHVPDPKESEVPAPSLRTLTAAAASAAVLATVSTQAAVGAELPADHAELHVTSFADGTRTEEVTGADGRFARRRFDADGTLKYVLVEDGTRLWEWDGDSNTAKTRPTEGGKHDNRFEQWERVYRSQIRAGNTRIADETVLDGRPVYVLRFAAIKGVPSFGEDPERATVYVDRDTWVPLRGERRADDGSQQVTFTATSRIVALDEAASLLRASRTLRAQVAKTAKRMSKRRASRR